MPNVETNNKNNAPSHKSQKKEKRKSLAVTTEKDVSPLRQETLSPITPALESGDSNLENVNKNPYIDVINKRIRKLSKTMIRIEKYETIKNSSDSEGALNTDQIKLLERKGEVSGAIKEFEETLKQIEAVEKDELKKQDEQKKAQQAERDQAIVSAVEETEAAHRKSVLQLIRFFRLVHFLQRNLVQLSDTQFEAVETFRAKLTTLSEEAENNELYVEKSNQVSDHVNKLRLGDESTITKSLSNGVHETDEGITYSQLRSLVQNPPILESSGEHEEPQETFESVPAPEITNQHEHIDDSSNVTSEFAIQPSGLQFMLHSDDQSQPQTFDTTINNATYVYQSTDAEQIPSVSTGETIVDHNVQEQYNQQQQNFDTYTVEQPQQFTEQYIVEQQQNFAEQNDQQEVEQELSSQQQESLSAQEPQTIPEDQVDSKQSQATQQNNNQPPPLTQGFGHRGSRGYRGNRGYRGHGPRKDSGGYSRDGNYGGYHRGGRGSGPRGGRGGGFQGNRGSPYRQRSQ